MVVITASRGVAVLHLLLHLVGVLCSSIIAKDVLQRRAGVLMRSASVSSSGQVQGWNFKVVFDNAKTQTMEVGPGGVVTGAMTQRRSGPEPGEDEENDSGPVPRSTGGGNGEDEENDEGGGIRTDNKVQKTLDDNENTAESDEAAGEEVAGEDAVAQDAPVESSTPGEPVAGEGKDSAKSQDLGSSTGFDVRNSAARKAPRQEGSMDVDANSTGFDVRNSAARKAPRQEGRKSMEVDAKRQDGDGSIGKEVEETSTNDIDGDNITGQNASDDSLEATPLQNSSEPVFEPTPVTDDSDFESPIKDGADEDKEFVAETMDQFTKHASGPPLPEETPEPEELNLCKKAESVRVLDTRDPLGHANWAGITAGRVGYCSKLLSIGSFPLGKLQKCASMVARNSSCSNTFLMNGTSYECLCVPHLELCSEAESDGGQNFTTCIYQMNPGEFTDEEAGEKAEPTNS